MAGLRYIYGAVDVLFDILLGLTNWRGSDGPTMITRSVIHDAFNNIVDVVDASASELKSCCASFRKAKHHTDSFTTDFLSGTVLLKYGYRFLLTHETANLNNTHRHPKIYLTWGSMVKCDGL